MWSDKGTTRLEKVIGRGQALQLADNAMHLDDVSKVLAESRRQVRTHNGGPAAEEDSMIHIGDVNYAASDLTPPGFDRKPPTAAPSILPSLAKGLIGAGLLASGIGAPIGAWLIADAIRSAKPAAVETVKEWESRVEMKVHPPETKQ